MPRTETRTTPADYLAALAEGYADEKTRPEVERLLLSRLGHDAIARARALWGRQEADPAPGSSWVAVFADAFHALGMDACIPRSGAPSIGDSLPPAISESRRGETFEARTPMPGVLGVELARGVVEAVRRPDGSVVVEDVPVFSEVRPEDPGALDGSRTPRDRAWLEAAVAKDQAQRALGYLTPMTCRHVFDSPDRVGHVELDRVALVEVAPGDERWTILGRKVYRDIAAFERARDHDYRSAEVSPDDPDAISALALLRDRAPVFKYPSLRERLAPEAAKALESFRARGGSAPQVFKESPMMLDRDRMAFEARYPAAADARRDYEAALRSQTPETFSAAEAPLHGPASAAANLARARADLDAAVTAAGGPARALTVADVYREAERTHGAGTPKALAAARSRLLELGIRH